MTVGINQVSTTRRSTTACLLLLPFAVSPLGIGGCAGEQKLETGYAYQPLNSTSVERRAFYADPYSLEAMEAQAQRRSRNRAAPLPGGS